MRLSCAIGARSLLELTRYGRTHSRMTRVETFAAADIPQKTCLWISGWWLAKQTWLFVRSWLDTMDIEAESFGSPC